MTPASPPLRRAYRRLRVPAFYPVPTRTRRDGWTVERQADPSTKLRTGFLGMLAETGSVIGACEAVGISRTSAYRLRALPGAESFAAARQSDSSPSQGDTSDGKRRQFAGPRRHFRA